MCFLDQPLSWGVGPGQFAEYDSVPYANPRWSIATTEEDMGHNL